MLYCDSTTDRLIVIILVVLLLMAYVVIIGKKFECKHGVGMKICFQNLFLLCS